MVQLNHIIFYFVGMWVARTRTFSMARGSRRNAPKLMIVMTDGASTVDADKTCDEARQVR